MLHQQEVYRLVLCKGSLCETIALITKYFIVPVRITRIRVDSILCGNNINFFIRAVPAALKWNRLAQRMVRSHHSGSFIPVLYIWKQNAPFFESCTIIIRYVLRFFCDRFLRHRSRVYRENCIILMGVRLTKKSHARGLFASSTLGVCSSFFKGDVLAIVFLILSHLRSLFLIKERYKKSRTPLGILSLSQFIPNLDEHVSEWSIRSAK